jgi:hypothetical protein
MSAESQDNFKALRDMRDRALILVMGNDYLCETPLLKRFGRDIDKSSEQIREDIASLKKRFPGRFAFELDTNQIIDKILATAKRLQEPDQELDNLCKTGELGQELSDHINALARAIQEIKAQVEGASLTYTSKDSLLKGVDALKGVGSSAGRAAGRFSKLLVTAVFLCILALSYLYMTMEKEGPFLKEASQIEMRVQAQKERIADLDKKKRELSGKINALRDMRQNRETRVEILELSGRLHDVEEKITQAEAQILIYERDIQELRRKIQKLRNQSFVERLLHL